MFEPKHLDEKFDSKATLTLNLPNIRFTLKPNRTAIQKFKKADTEMKDKTNKNVDKLFLK